MHDRFPWKAMLICLAVAILGTLLIAWFPRKMVLPPAVDGVFWPTSKYSFHVATPGLTQHIVQFDSVGSPPAKAKRVRPHQGVNAWINARRGFNETIVGATGWPLLCFWYAQRDPKDVSTRHGAIQTPDDWLVIPGRIVPLHPRWTALLFNIGVLWIAVFAAWWLLRDQRTRIRDKQGCCLSCGYDRADLPRRARCPECGAKNRLYVPWWYEALKNF